MMDDEYHEWMNQDQNLLTYFCLLPESGLSSDFLTTGRQSKMDPFLWKRQRYKRNHRGAGNENDWARIKWFILRLLCEIVTLTQIRQQMFENSNDMTTMR